MTVEGKNHMWKPCRLDYMVRLKVCKGCCCKSLIVYDSFAKMLEPSAGCKLWFLSASTAAGVYFNHDRLAGMTHVRGRCMSLRRRRIKSNKTPRDLCKRMH